MVKLKCDFLKDDSFYYSSDFSQLLLIFFVAYQAKDGQILRRISLAHQQSIPKDKRRLSDISKIRDEVWEKVKPDIEKGKIDDNIKPENVVGYTPASEVPDKYKDYVIKL